MDMMCMEFSTSSTTEKNIKAQLDEQPSMMNMSHLVELGVSAKCHYLQKEDLEESLMYQLTGEETTMPAKDYMHRIQEDVNAPNWRKRIVEWMIEASSEFDMSIDTVACAVNYMDRYLSEFKADKVLLQLLAMVCLSLASKMFETQPITMDEMRMLSRGAFQKVDIRDVEKQVLLSTHWNLNPITAQSVSRHVLNLEPHGETRELLETHVFLMLEMALKDHAFLQFKPSTLALASVFAAHMKSNRAVGSSLRTIISSFAWSMDDVRTCQRAFLDATTPHVIVPSNHNISSSSSSPFIDTTNLMDHHNHHHQSLMMIHQGSHTHHSTAILQHRSDSPTAIEDFVQVMNDENKPPTHQPQPHVHLNHAQHIVVKPAQGQPTPRTMVMQHPNKYSHTLPSQFIHHHPHHGLHHHHSYASSSSSNSKKRSRLEV